MHKKTVEIENKEDEGLILALVKRINAKVSSNNFGQVDSHDYKALIEWSDSFPVISDLFRIWKGKNITLDQIRKKAWRTN
ncbi:MAG: hypothetical protein NWS46_12435 [Cyclobacteriaceae bacterium]|jgi:hypothetical protein|nr:hypothetical protein [Cyclobacteriaceae bacterium]